MEPHERVRYLRKQYLKMTQTEFGEHLGVSRSVINNIELNYLSRPEKKISLLKLICREFGVSEEWLLYGKGEMLVDNNNEYDLLVDRIIPETNQFARNIFINSDSNTVKADKKLDIKEDSFISLF